MNEQIRIISEEILANDWGTLTKVTFDYLRRNGQWQRQTREVYDHGYAAAILLYNLEAGTIILTRQFRFPLAYMNEPAMMIEACAGLLDGDDPATCAKREAEEESGYRVDHVEHLFDAFMSPGSVTERVSFFFASYDANSKVSDGGGLHHEGEDIEVLEMSFDAAYAMIGTGEICNAPTILLLQQAKIRGLFDKK
jgi:nudix-type nucleoside diphosphatase (YffH/AdpP family)